MAYHTVCFGVPILAGEAAGTCLARRSRSGDADAEGVGLLHVDRHDLEAAVAGSKAAEPGT